MRSEEDKPRGKRERREQCWLGVITSLALRVLQRG